LTDHTRYTATGSAQKSSQLGTHGVRVSHIVVVEIASAAINVLSPRSIVARGAQPPVVGGGRCLEFQSITAGNFIRCGFWGGNRGGLRLSAIAPDGAR